MATTTTAPFDAKRARIQGHGDVPRRRRDTRRASITSRWGGRWRSAWATRRRTSTAFRPRRSTSFAGVGHYFHLAGIRPGETVVDLGSGSGMDSFLAGLMVGPGGKVIGVDMTDAQRLKAEWPARP